MSEKFENSLKNGTHYFLKSLEGNYEGTTSVWFEPDSTPEVSACTGTIKSILGGLFLLHEYKGSLQEKPLEGMAIFGYSIGDGKLQCAWIDSFHNGTAILFSENLETKLPYSVLGGYGAEPRWGWRTEINKNNDDTVVITMYNIPPEGTESKAVETIYKKIN